ncbi:MAG TPA: ion channel [Gemmatimonadaceae bacterium]|nr:ion channel [Gemmatimonadaceae bacterium]
MTAPGPRVDPREEERDLGFGAVVASERRHRLLNRDGTFNVARDGIALGERLNPYHWLLTMTWPRFLALLVGVFLLENAVFAGLYLLCGAGALATPSTGMPEGRFLQAFFFSVETFATIGYGAIYPVGVAANVLMTFESIVSLIGVAIVTGLMFARFSRPVARIRFSRTAVIAPYRGITALEFRLTNMRASQMVQLEAKVLFSRFDPKSGKGVREFSELPLERRQVVFFPLSWTIVHPIDDASPLRGVTAAQLAAMDAEFLVLLTGYDETFATTVHARTSYRAEEIVWGTKFRNIYEPPGTDGMVRIDVSRLDEVEG